jgi:hypothetical protein
MMSVLGVVCEMQPFFHFCCQTAHRHIQTISIDDHQLGHHHGSPASRVYLQLRKEALKDEKDHQKSIQATSEHFAKESPRPQSEPGLII